MTKQKTCSSCGDAFSKLGEFWLATSPNTQMQPYCSKCLPIIAQPALDYSVSEDVRESDVDETNPPVIVALHGGHLSRASLGPLARELNRLGFHVVQVDLPGHGSLFNEKFTRKGLITAVQRGLTIATNRWPQSKVYLFGHSLGGYAVYLGARECQPDGLLSEFEPYLAGIITSGASAIHMFPWFFRFLLWLTTKMPDEKKHNLMLKHELPHDWDQALKYETITGSGQYWGVIQDVVSSFRDFNTLHCINEMKEGLPLLLVNFKGDSKGRIGGERKLIKQEPHCRTLIKLEGNHLGPLTNHVSMSETISKWVSQLSVPETTGVSNQIQS